MTRLTDKEREAVAWMCKHATPHIRSEVYGSILASCVTRLDAPVGGLKRYKTASPRDAMWDVEKQNYNVFPMDEEFYVAREVDSLRSAAEAKIAGLVDVLTRAIEELRALKELLGPECDHDVNLCVCDLRRLIEDGEEALRALIETDGGEDANRN